MILFVTRMPPNPNGNGGCQRAMHLLKSLAMLGPVDVLYVSRQGDQEAVGDMLAPARDVANRCVHVQLPEWAPALIRWPSLSWRGALLTEIFTGFCADAPRLSSQTRLKVAKALPSRKYTAVFAGRLSCAVIVDQLSKSCLIQTESKMVDFDDVMSRFMERQVATDGARQGRLWRIGKKLDLIRVRAAERRVLRNWHAVSVCTDDDVALLMALEPGSNVLRVPNVVDKPRLPTSVADGRRLLFVGSLAFSANLVGLRAFLTDAWPKIRSAMPGSSLDVVGMLPPDGFAAEMESAGIRLSSNVPSVEPFYGAADIVISPILFGGGTRIKILEAMAYGRPIVATSIGAEGLDVKHGVHALIADGMDDFADAVIRLMKDADLRQSMASAAHSLQTSMFGPEVMRNAVEQMVDSGNIRSGFGK